MSKLTKLKRQAITEANKRLLKETDVITPTIQSIEGYNKTIQVRLDNYLQGWKDRTLKGDISNDTISKMNKLIGRIGSDIDLLNGIVRKG